jgi:hypothetical protein
MKRGIKTIIAGVVLFVLGAFVIPLLCGFLVVLPLFLGSSNEVQFKIPGTAEATVEKPGRYYVWNDYRTFYQGKNYDRSERIPDGVEIRIHDSKGGLLEFVGSTAISSTAGSSSKNSIGYVDIERPGKVSIEVSGGNEERVFSFAQSGILKLFGSILGAFGLSMLVAIAGFGITIWGIVKMVKAEKKG